jgi:hypothetical protein
LGLGTGVECSRDPDRKPRPARPACRGRFLVDPRADAGDMLGRDQIEDHLVGVPRRDAGHRGSERRDADRCIGLRSPKFEATDTDVLAVEVDSLAIEDRA